jgi:ADP-L-glycero-D-manno-heptose 6-epimerase
MSNVVFLTEETKDKGLVEEEEVLLKAGEKKAKVAPKKPVKPIPKITIVTGGAGFIGSHLIEQLNNRANERILLVDDLSAPEKLQNIKDLKFQDYCDISKFSELFMYMAEKKMVDAVYHMGADSNVNSTDGKHMMENNYQNTCNIMDICYMNKIPMVYASSAAIYGQQTKEWGKFDDSSDDYVPESYYALAKLQADKYSRKFVAEGPDIAKIIGLRYFNVTSDGKREQHKGDMKSATCWMKEQYDETGMIRLFNGSAEIYRDFVPVEQVARMTINAMMSGRSGVYNIGTGESRSFLELALEIVDGDESKITYFTMPYEMQDRYQTFTQANMNNACFGIMSRP